MKTDTGKFDFIDHTADTGIAVRSPSLEGIFSTAATGMLSIITNVEKIENKIHYPVSLYANENIELLVRWLHHLNYLFSTEGFLCHRIDPIVIMKGHLETIVWGDLYNSNKHELFGEIKAVTYHQLILEPQKEGWFAQVIFDI